MTPDEIYAAWAYEDSPWRAWVKPVLFAYLGIVVDPPALGPDPTWPRKWVLPPSAERLYRDAPPADTAVVIDLPGASGVRVGLALASLGFRPVPLYNAIPAADAIVPVVPIIGMLVAGAPRLAALPAIAPPAFLLDADRAGPWLAPIGDYFDNRGMCRDTDFPSAATLVALGIARVTVVLDRDTPAPDLERVLHGWQREGIALSRVGNGPAQPFVARRRLFAAAWRALGDWRRGNRRDDGNYGAAVRTYEQQPGG